MSQQVHLHMILKLPNILWSDVYRKNSLSYFTNHHQLIGHIKNSRVVMSVCTELAWYSWHLQLIFFVFPLQWGRSPFFLQEERVTKGGMEYSRALLPPSGQQLSSSILKMSSYTHTHTISVHTRKNLIWWDHCAKSPFFNLNMAGSKEHLKHDGRVNQGRHKPLHRRQPD